MNIIIDANVLFSALIKDSTTRQIILEYERFFLFPAYIFTELEKHKSELLRKSEMDEKEFYGLLEIIIRKVIIIPDKILIPYKEKAFEIIKDIDPDDVLFIACALAYPSSIIWSDDKELKKQSKIRIATTKDIIRFFEERRI